jgi:hypothetical protein
MNESKYFLFYWVQPFKVHIVHKQKLYTKPTNYLNSKSVNHYIILLLLHSNELHKNGKKRCTEVAFHEKKYTKIFVSEAILLPSRLAVVDSHSFASISSTYKLNRVKTRYHWASKKLFIYCYTATKQVDADQTMHKNKTKASKLLKH